MEYNFDNLTQRFYFIVKDVKIFFEDLLKEIKETKVIDNKIEINKLTIEVIKIAENYFNINFGINEPRFLFYSPIKLKINEETIYEVYSENQYNLFVKSKFLEGKEYIFYLIKENNEKQRIRLEDFYLYSGETIIPEKVEPEKINEDIIKRKIPYYLKDLSIDYIYLFSKKGEIEQFNETIFSDKKRDEFQKDILNFIKSKNNYFKKDYKHIIGNTGVGKTVSLLDLRYKYRNILYINLKLYLISYIHMNPFIKF